MKHNYLFLFCLAFLLSCQSDSTPKIDLQIIPTPAQIDSKNGFLSLKSGFNINVKNEQLEPLTDRIRKEFYLLTGIEEIENNGGQLPVFQLSIDSSLRQENYHLSIDKSIKISGGSYAAISMGLVTVWQLLDKKLQLPRLEIQDKPASQYRSLMVDLARAWHDISTLKELIVLCQWYKINYLHLHLTDDQSITFSSTIFPNLATEGRQYTKEELIELNEFAYQRGVILVPEIDVPGHSSEFIKNMPDLFGIKDLKQNPYTINIGKEETYQALDKLLGEIATVFSYSPYIHIGGDEAFFKGIEHDPDVITYMQDRNISSVKELFRHFIVRLNGMVKTKGKKTIVWAGFGEKGEIEIPKDVIVMLWEPQYYAPEQLQKDGYKIINASWKPLYVVNNRKWSADYIYEQWNPRRWESWANTGGFVGTELATRENILGATMCAWEQRPWNELHRLRKRIPAMTAHLWQEKTTDLADFNEKIIATDAKLSQLLQPFTIEETGLTYPDWQEGNFNEHAWFDKTVRIDLKSRYPDLIIRYALSDKKLTNNSPIYEKPIWVKETTTLTIGAYTQKGKLVGLPMLKKYFHQPLTIIANPLEKDLLPNSWEKHRFEKELTIELNHPYEDAFIQYTLDGSTIKDDSPIYNAPIQVNKTTHLNAQLIQKNGESIGSVQQASYYLLKNRPSLTTDKPTTASNQHIRPKVADVATNGRVTLWEQWGDHNNGNNWIKVDLEKIQTVRKFKIYTFWDGYRYYQYTIEGSKDGKDWTILVDASENTEISTDEGQEHLIDAVAVRYLKLNVLYNSANPGLHVVEFSAF